MVSLERLAKKHRADKRADVHDYCKLYEWYMAGRRNDPIALLEIGVKFGKSLAMWREYFPNGTIYGVEINEFDDPLVYHGSACDPDLVAQMPTFDFIIDDGSHIGEDQVAAFNLLWPHLNPGGVYSCEDMTYGYKHGDRVAIKKFFSLVHACNWHGKCVQASYEYQGKHKPLNRMEREVEYVHFYTGIAFVQKRAEI